MVDEDLVFDPATAFTDGRSPVSTSVVALTDRGKRKLERMRRVVFESHQEQQQQAEDNVVSSQVMSLILVVVILLRLEKLQEFVTVCAWTGQVRF